MKILNKSNYSDQNVKLQVKQKAKISIVCISDSHGEKMFLDDVLKISGDIFIHGGDFTYYGQQKHFHQFFQFLDKLDFKHKIVISGNHQISLDDNTIEQHKKQSYRAVHPCSMSRSKIIHELKKRCIYLEHQMIQIQGIKIFGSPYTPFFVGNAFQYHLFHQKAIWDQIPQNLDILLTHGPPFNILDKNGANIHVGSKYLATISKLRSPKYHIFGHIHEDGGKKLTIDKTTYMNIAQTTVKFEI